MARGQDGPGFGAPGWNVGPAWSRSKGQRGDYRVEGKPVHPGSGLIAGDLITNAETRVSPELRFPGRVRIVPAFAAWPNNWGTANA